MPADKYLRMSSCRMFVNMTTLQEMVYRTLHMINTLYRFFFL